MATTAIFAEILIIGLQAGAWLALLAASILGTESVSIQNLKEWQTFLILPGVAIAYVLGILVDRVADTIFVTTMKLKRNANNFMAKRKWGFVKWKLNIKFIKKGKDKTPFRKMRLKILMQNDGVAKFIDYQRSRLRIARATAFNLPFIIITGIVFLFTRTDFSNDQIAMFSIVGVILIILSWYVALRIESALTKTLKEAYKMINSNQRR